MIGLTAAMCVTASLLLAWRLVSRWDDSTGLVRALAALLGASVFLASVAATVAMYAAGDTLVARVVLLLVFAHGVGCVMVAALWPSLEYRFVIPDHRALHSR